MIGIYSITNIVDGKVYYGSSLNIKARLIAHKGLLTRGKHPSTHLQHAYNKYGENCFVFQIVEETTRELLLIREQQYIDNAYGTQCYNIRKIAESNKGVRMNEETKAKISNSMKSVMYKGSPAAIRHSKNMRGKVFADKEERANRARHITMRRWDGFISPNGIVYKDINDLAKFAKEHNVDAQGLRRIGRFERKSYKGWKVYG